MDQFHIEVLAREKRTYIGVKLDESKKTAGIFLEPDTPRTFEPAQRLMIRYEPSDAKVLEITINGRKAQLPADRAEMVITKEDYERLLQ